VPLYRPEVSIYSVMAGLARQQELTTLGTFHDRNGDQRLAAGAGNRTAAWGRLFGQHMEQSHWGHAGASFEGNMGGLQSGLDVAQWVSRSGHQDRFGLFAAYARTTGDVEGFALGIDNIAAGRAELDGTSVGGYWTHLAPSGWYTDTVIMGTRFDGQGSAMGDEVNLSGYGVVASIEGGYPIAIAPGVRLEPQAQLVFQHVNFHDVDDPFAHVAYDTPDALFGRIGLRLSADLLPLPMVLRPYLKANVWQDFTETDTIRFSGIHQILSRHETTTLEFGGGIVAQLSPGMGLWASAEYTTDIGGSDESRESVRGTAGLRVVW
jgi:autotransporter family porin